MKLAISNIAWIPENNNKIYELMNKYGFSGLEIAPTKNFPQNPYDNVNSAVVWANDIKSEYGFSIPSMQSIWFGKSEKIFGPAEERQVLIDYTKKAIDFASAIECRNLVFGCPKNRNITQQSDIEIAFDFFKELGDYAYSKGTIIGMEANPKIYNTNFINNTQSAIELIKLVNSDGFKLNLDIGTMIYNNESLEELYENVNLINHVHISEPYLAAIENRDFHKKIINILKSKNYDKFISIEMKQQESIDIIEDTLKYVRGLI